MRCREHRHVYNLIQVTLNSEQRLVFWLPFGVEGIKARLNNFKFMVERFLNLQYNFIAGAQSGFTSR